MELTTEQFNDLVQQVKTAILAESQGVGELSKATDLTGISSLPALKVIDGVESVVDVPISLLTPNLRVNGTMVQYKDPIAGTWGDIIAVADIQGKSAFEIAVSLGYTGTSAEWIESLKQPAKDAATELASYISNISSNTRRITAIEKKTSLQSVCQEDGFFVTDDVNNIGLKYDSNGLDVAAFAAHFITLLKSYLNVGIANGIAPLNNSGQIAATYLPSYVDDVVEFDSIIETATITDNESIELGGIIVYVSSVARFVYLLNGVYYNEFPDKDKYEDPLLFPLDGKIYIDKSTNQQYRWSGTQLSEISSSLALGETESSAFAGNRGLALEANIIAMQTIVSSLFRSNNSILTKVNTISSVSEDGFFVCDSNGYIGLKYDSNGLDVSNLTTHIESIIKSIEGIGLTLGTTSTTAYRGDLGYNNEKNITELQQKVSALKSSGTSYDNILQTYEDGFYITDENGNVAAYITGNISKGFGGDLNYNIISELEYEF